MKTNMKKGFDRLAWALSIPAGIIAYIITDEFKPYTSVTCTIFAISAFTYTWVAVKLIARGFIVQEKEHKNTE